MGLKKQQDYKGFLPEYWKIKELKLVSTKIEIVP
jgi:hypothetical protein